MATITFYDSQYNAILMEFPITLVVGMNVVTLPDGTTLHVRVRKHSSDDPNRHTLTFWHSMSSWEMEFLTYYENMQSKATPVGLTYCGKVIQQVRIASTKDEFKNGASTPDAWKDASQAVLELMQKLKQIQDQNEVVKTLQQQNLTLLSGVVKVGEDGKTYIVTDVKKETPPKQERKNEAEYVEL